MLLWAKYGLEMIWLDHLWVPEVSSRGKYVAQFYFLFIKELANEIMQRARPVMQLIPDVIEIFILLFADDVILVSDAACGLQNHLNVLFDTSNRLSLYVNMEKNNNNNKIIVFRNREHGWKREVCRHSNGNCEYVQVFWDIFFYPAFLFSRTKRHVTAS